MKKSILFIFFYVFILPQVISQVPCSFDSSFATNGQLVTDSGTICERILALPNGNVLVAYNISGSGHAYVRRLSNTGSVDNSYGVSGKATIQVAGPYTQIKSLLWHDDKLYICGVTHTGYSLYPYITRLKDNGTRDSTFGSAGMVAFPTYYRFTDMIMEPGTDKILVTGTKDTDVATVIRLHNNGNLDSTFGNFGSTDISTTHIDIYYNISDIAVDKNKRILITGRLYTITGSTFSKLCVMRFLPSGTLDSSFNGTGKLHTNFSTSSSDEGIKLFVDDNNDYYLCNKAFSGTSWDYSLAKIKNNGVLDSTFGSGGWKIYDLVGTNSREKLWNAQMLSNGNFLMTGEIELGDTTYFTLFSVKPDGTPDNSFAPNGLFIHTFGAYDRSRSFGLSLTNDGKIYLSGSVMSCPGGKCGPRYGSIAKYFGASGSTTHTTHIEKNKLVIYPNPISDNGIFFINNFDTNVELVKAYNMLGQEIAIKQIGANTYQLIHAPVGNYVVKLSTKDNKYSQVLSVR